MNVGFLVPELINCGPINLVLTLAENLKEIGHNVKLISIRESQNSDIFEKFKISCSLGVFTLNENHNLIKDMVDDLDVIHSHGFYPDKILHQLNINNVKKISTVHCMFYKDYLGEYGFIKGLLGALFHFNYLKKGDFNYIVGCSSSIENYICNKISKKNIACINNGVNQEIYNKINLNEMIERKIKIGVNKYKKIFVYAGRLIRRKRVPELINIFQEKYSKDNLLIILGDGEEFEKCKKNAYKNVLFLGSVNNPEYYYQIADYVISNSAAEGYPMSILEAVSCGCFAILSNIEPHLEFIKHNSELGCLIGDELTKENSYTSNVDNLSSKIMALEYLKLYES